MASGSSTRGSVPDRASAPDSIAFRHWLYLVALVVVLGIRTIYTAASDSWWLFLEYWPVTATMSFGSFLADATAEGGTAVEFQEFTKVLGIDAETAWTFGSFVQAVGMVLALVAVALSVLGFSTMVRYRVAHFVPLVGSGSRDPIAP